MAAAHVDRVVALNELRGRWRHFVQPDRMRRQNLCRGVLEPALDIVRHGVPLQTDAVDGDLPSADGDE
eukprot:scaffold7066_cov253-Pinguiococcus_pyrenoidosus.AAC.1